MEVENISTELVELYENSGSEFFAEALAFIRPCMPDLILSLFAIEHTGNLKILTTDITDMDEGLFWCKALRNEISSKPKTSFKIPIERTGMKSHLVIPLWVRDVLCGLWVLESRECEEFEYKRNYKKIAKLMALFIRQEQLSRKCIQNIYLDAGTELPGRFYFLKIINQLRVQGYELWISVFRIVKYREGIRFYGIDYMEECFSRLLRKVQSLQLGNVYVLSEDTVAFISNENERECFAGAKQMMNFQMCNVLVSRAFLNLAKEEHILTLLEEVFVVTPAGNIWRREQNPVASLFLSDGMETTAKGNPEENQELSSQELVEELLLEFMERT